MSAMKRKSSGSKKSPSEGFTAAEQKNQFERIKYILLGDENASNLRLSQILRQAYGKENVARFFELHYLEPFLAANQRSAIVVCLDLFNFDVRELTDTVGRIRDTYPRVVFNLYLDRDEYRRRSNELPEQWQERF